MVMEPEELMRMTRVSALHISVGEFGRLLRALEDRPTVEVHGYNTRGDLQYGEVTFAAGTELDEVVRGAEDFINAMPEDGKVILSISADKVVVASVRRGDTWRK